jgi:hypothetical protein
MYRGPAARRRVAVMKRGGKGKKGRGKGKKGKKGKKK